MINVTCRRLAALPIALGCLLVNAGYAHADDAASLHKLIDSSDFVGIVVADPNIAGMSTSTEYAFVYSADPFKGSFTHATPTQYSYIHADRESHGGYPAWYSDKAEYLVFLNLQTKDAQPYYITRAAYRVDYRPDQSGKVTGHVFGGAMSIIEARKLIQQETITGLPSASAEGRISPLLTADSINVDQPSTYEDRLKLAQQLVAGIKQGTSREDVEKIFRQQDGGAVGSYEQRYYFGNDVMIYMPYDDNGGPFSPKNRVEGTITIKRSMMHLD